MGDSHADEQPIAERHQSGSPAMMAEVQQGASGALRVAYLSGSPRIATRDDAGVSGPRAHILGLIEAWRRQGHTVDAYVLGDRVPRSLSAEGVQRSRLSGGLRRVAVDAVRLGMRRSVAARARRELPGSYDVVYERFALFQELGRSFRESGAAWVVESNAVVSQEARQEHNALALQAVAARLERRTYRQADLVVCVSTTLRDMLVAQLGVPADKIMVLPNGVDTERFQSDGLPAGEVSRHNELVVGFVGFVVERQGLDELIRAVAMLRRQAVAVAVRVVIVGSGPALADLTQLAASEGVGEAVEFRGQLSWSEVPAVIATFSVGYSGQRGVSGMPMYHSPLKIYEYLASGRPVVAADHEDARRVLVDEGAGWTFPPGDVAKLAEVLSQVAGLERDELSTMGVRARKVVQEQHSWAHRAEQIVQELTGRGLLG